MRNIILAVLSIYIFDFNTIWAQQDNQSTNEKPDFDKYEVSCYCSISGQSPGNILKLDNNGSIILQLIEGKTKEQINGEFISSQLELLKTFRLIRKENNVWITNMPILDEQKTLKLREYTKRDAEILDSVIHDDVVNLVNTLTQLDRNKNSYTILFSYVLDDLVWRNFEEKKILKQRGITAETPFWSGVVWAVYPPREFSCGTNKISDKGVSFNINWTEKAISKMLPFVSDWNNMLKMFTDLIEKGEVKDTDARTVFDKYNLYDQTGKFTVPVIIESPDSSLYQNCVLLADKISGKVVNLTDFSKLTKEFSTGSNEETLVIYYHELMWDLLDFYEKKNIISKPVVFSNPEKSSPGDISDLVFIVKQ